MSVPAKISELVQRFQQNETEYRSISYNETQTKNDFITPFFEALGWDIRNEKRSSEAYREVIYEYSVKIGDTHKAPDYCFRIGKSPQFFVEAKKPSINIAQNTKPAFQLRRYGWSASLPVSILTDFEEFAVYDCRIQPNVKDLPTVARILYFKYTDYIDKWDEIAALFSREAVLAGSLNQFITLQTIHKGNQTVDDAFLNEIENWRSILAANLVFYNPEITSRDLNFAVQITINRLIFLRICEDRGTENYGRLEELQQDSNVYDRLCQIFREADDRYNSGLFHFKDERNRPDFDNFTLTLIIGDLPLKNIIKNLYYPSPYEFSVIPIEIIGQVYEQFLGKIITLSTLGVTVEDKPEVRKAGGVYYTPVYIVDYIVKNTVGKLLEGKTAKQAAKLKILDPSCGSGSFLIGVYQYLLEWYRDYYLKNPTRNSPIYESISGWQLTTTEKKKILLDNIFGVDIDAQAVEVTKLSLLLRVLEGESQESVTNQLRLFKERALPDLDNNIKCGNSLIDSGFYDKVQMSLLREDEVYRINVFDWQNEFSSIMKSGGFDAVIGNPPYIRIQTLKEWAARETEFYKQTYLAASKGNYDICVVFLEKGLSLLNKTGKLGYILPHKFFNAQYGEPIRKIISTGKHLSEVVHFGDQQVFTGPTTYTCLIFLDKVAASECEIKKISNILEWCEFASSIDTKIDVETITYKNWNFPVGSDLSLFERLNKMPVKAKDIVDKISQGIRTSANKIYVLDLIEKNEKSVVVYSNKIDSTFEIESQLVSLFLKGKEIKKYRTIPSNQVVIIPYLLEKGSAKLITENEMLLSFPKTFTYLLQNREYLSNREKGKMNNSNWYGYVYPKNLELMKSPKILVPDIADRASFAMDKIGEYTFTSGYGITFKNTIRESPEYILGLLNSKVLNFYIKNVSTQLRGGFFRYFTQFIEQLPIRLIDFEVKNDRENHDRMVSLVEQITSLHNKLKLVNSPNEKNMIEKQIEVIDCQIDRLVYQLYELTEQEIAIVEQKES
ncbi:MULTISPECIES: Eco57I restriction-modification methylase domain-containing protein [Pseudanabaena]|uniref:Eco57I restriction-modification methylase domain-containing protein n=1 Tax=Pseudanabaena TaxID=1152 RepID=UPI00247922C2|nr:MULTISPECIES: N-6 DNA methylase [Pseudanabaena]MEA5487878.1 N-6 DNA methylase [Pseudanabaena sp. CCNP1317]WGS72182.1 Eco57I restriction-modification methylase domain-containing protein [Pseudanabaena galeata CCNP1313]